MQVNHRALRSTFTAAVLASFAGGAVAGDGWYLGLEGGSNWQRQSNDTQSFGGLLGGQSPFASKYDNGWVGGVTSGYAFSNGFRPEVELAYRQDRYKRIFDSASSAEGDGRKDTRSAFANLWYDLKSDSGLFKTVHPYIGVGGGVSQLWLENVGSAGQELVNDHDTVFAYQGGAGIGFDLSRRLTASVDYRYVGTEKGYFEANPGAGGGRVNSGFNGQSALLSVRYVLAEQKPSDLDGDGVPDKRDVCPNTAPGTPVDSTGCALDADKDGVNDKLDVCPNTPAGATVDAKGCPIDSDGDRVPDYADQCPNTPPGTDVDAKGCTIAPPAPAIADTDGDGVADGIDQCPNTPPGKKVTANGCAVNQSLILKNVHFAFAKSLLTNDSKTVLDTVAKTIIDSPGFQIEIAGYTDSVGSDAQNLKLSEARAQSVRTYLVSRGVSASVLSAHGYGESNPVASNDDETGRADNRRVEMKIIN
ncbi:OmpA family protein [Nevskia ramosa]|uniref:OmpA family protein n=1 Tax=Nevskia ramosa TaxID=64002 RepID=UPI0003B768CE|nr:OmpA family protein [Nevskia ramosa]